MMQRYKSDYKVMGRLTNRIGSAAILYVKRSITIRTMINFETVTETVCANCCWKQQIKLQGIVHTGANVNAMWLMVHSHCPKPSRVPSSGKSWIHHCCYELDRTHSTSKSYCTLLFYFKDKRHYKIL